MTPEPLDAPASDLQPLHPVGPAVLEATPDALLPDEPEFLTIRGAREHNLKGVDLDLPREQLVVITGLSGSGKSSLAFDTIYAEGQRRFMESLSAYARQFLGVIERPDVDHIEGLSPVIAIEQKTTNLNPRSTVGTVTEIYDFLRLLYARVARPNCYNCGRPIQKQTADQILDAVLSLPTGSKLQLLAPVVRGRKGHYREQLERIRKDGYLRARIDGQTLEIIDGLRLDRYKVHTIEAVIDRVVVTPESRQRISGSLDAALAYGSGSVVVEHQIGRDRTEDLLFSQHYACSVCHISYEEPAPNLFSFNSPFGACPDCDGLGHKREIDPELILPDPTLSIHAGGVAPLGKPRDTWQFAQLRGLADALGFTFDTPVGQLPDEARRILLDGSGDDTYAVRMGAKGKAPVTYKVRLTGLIEQIRKAFDETTSTTGREWAESFMSSHTCPTCGGGRLKRESLSYRLANANIHDLVGRDIRSLRQFLDTVDLSDRQREIGTGILKEVRTRLDFLLDVGLEYLTLDRPTRSLSGGEAQRIRLATQIGSQLVGVLYVLDEPSIGLHQRDNEKLIESLRQLRDLGNTVLVVEHDRDMIEAADYVVDLGPGAGEHGGRVMSQGRPGAMNGDSLTTAYLRGDRAIEIPAERRKGNGQSLVLHGARGHNLHDVTLRLPLATFTAVTGVSGSGKSSLVNQTLLPILARQFYRAKEVPLPYRSVEGLEHLDKVIAIDQSPIGRTPRSNPATYTGLFGLIRDLYATLPESKIRGYGPGRFSFNVKGGRCEACEGDGIKRIEMNFLPDVYVPCEVCKGARYNGETLEVLFRGASIANVLDMTVTEAVAFFDAVPRIKRKLETLHDVGLGYLRLGQQAPTLSGGEAQRVKLATELSKVATGRTLYILDEPTTGLHFEDIRHLLEVLDRLVEKGNSVLVIEHNLDVIKVADQVIDLGPEGGSGGGFIVCEGTPETVAACPDSHTGRFLAKELAAATVRDARSSVRAASRSRKGRADASPVAEAPDETEAPAKPKRGRPKKQQAES